MQGAHFFVTLFITNIEQIINWSNSDNSRSYEKVA